MPTILDSTTLADGHQLVVVASATSNSGMPWANSYRLRLVETDGTTYKHLRARNVVRVLADHWADGRYRGQRSGWSATVEGLRELMFAEAAGRHSGEEG